MGAEAAEKIEELRAAGKLKALPIVGVDREQLTLYSCDGMELCEYGKSGTWVSTDRLCDGSIRYLGSASHAGHIELKALYVMLHNEWHNILSGTTEPYKGS